MHERVARLSHRRSWRGDTTISTGGGFEHPVEDRNWWNDEARGDEGQPQSCSCIIRARVKDRSTPRSRDGEGVAIGRVRLGTPIHFRRGKLEARKKSIIERPIRRPTNCFRNRAQRIGVKDSSGASPDGGFGRRRLDSRTRTSPATRSRCYIIRDTQVGSTAYRLCPCMSATSDPDRGHGVRTHALVAAVPNPPPSKEFFWQGATSTHDRERYLIVRDDSSRTATSSDQPPAPSRRLHRDEWPSSSCTTRTLVTRDPNPPIRTDPPPPIPGERSSRSCVKSSEHERLSMARNTPSPVFRACRRPTPRAVEPNFTLHGA